MSNKKNRPFKVMQGGGPGLVRAPSPLIPEGMTAEDLARLPAGAVGPMRSATEARTRIEIEEADFLKFRLTKEWESNLQMKEKDLEETRRRFESERRNLAAMEETVRAKEDSLANFRQIVQMRIGNVYGEIGIEPGDEVKNVNGETFIERPIRNKPVDYRVEHKDGKEVLKPVSPTLPVKAEPVGEQQQPKDGGNPEPPK